MSRQAYLHQRFKHEDMLGAGTFGAVYANSDDTVSKVVLNKHNAAYLRYVRLLEEQPCQFGPRILKVEPVCDYTIVTMERLRSDPLPLTECIRASHGQAIQAVVECLHMQHYPQALVTQVVRETGAAGCRSLAQAKQLVLLCKHILAAALVGNAYDPISRLDLAPRNILQRTDGSIVVTDPVF